MFWRIIFTFIVIGILGNIFLVIYFGQISDKTKGEVIADVAKSIGYETELRMYNFWESLAKALYNLNNELQKPAKRK